MAPLLGIASGAVNIAKKIFEGVKNRKDKKIEKKATALLDAQNQKAAIDNKLGALFSSMGGADTKVQSGSGNVLASLKGAFSPNPAIANFQPRTGAQAVQEINQEAAKASNGGGGMNPMYLILGAGVLLLFFFKRGR
jgi:hypothetical protein